MIYIVNFSNILCFMGCVKWSILRKREERIDERLFNVLKKTLKKEFGYQKYTQYATSIRKGIRESKAYSTDIFNDIYNMVKEKNEEDLNQMQERLNSSLLDAFHISKNYMGAFIAYLIAFSIMGSYAIEMVAVPGMLFISALFLIKTYEFVVNKFCYIDAHMVLIYKSVLERVLKERKTSIQ